jgi:hypothetical protein
MAWPVVTYQGVQYRQAQGNFLVPVDASTGVAIIMLREDGGIGAGFQAIEQGPPGKHAEIDATVNFTPLAWDSPTADSASWTELVPPDDDTPGLYRLNLALHLGEPGTDGASVLNPASFGTPVAKRLLVVKNDLSGFQFQPQLVGDRWLPATITDDYSGSGNNTAAVISVDAQPTDWRPSVEAHTVVNGTDTLVDLIARLNGETSGNIIARCRGIAAVDRLTIVSAPAAGSSDAFDKVSANVAAQIYIRTEKQSGSGTYARAASDTWCSVRVNPIL